MHEALLYQKLDESTLLCNLCAHHCRLKPDAFGICGVRQNVDGILYTYVYGELAAAHVDPIEKKPLYHFLPGSTSYSIATEGCNFKCGFCQNWQLSQARRGKDARSQGPFVKPEEIVKEAIRSGCKSVSFTYTEPTIYFEYAFDIAKLAKAEGLRTVFVTNGFMTEEALDTIHPNLDACNVDLKAFTERFYAHTCKARLAPVLAAIRHMKKLGIWIEITTLVIPGENDSDKEFADIAGFIAGVDPAIPWHISRFHPQYEFLDHPSTPGESLARAAAAGARAGLIYIYLGNVDEETNTRCPSCQSTLVRRHWFDAKVTGMKGGTCEKCGAKIEGVWQ
jgi:pyruvate formate lyase activating enzyme